MFSRSDIINLKDQGHDVLQYQRSLGKNSTFTRVTNASDYDNSNTDTVKRGISKAIGNKL